VAPQAFSSYLLKDLRFECRGIPPGGNDKKLTADDYGIALCYSRKITNAVIGFKATVAD
jgi:hypothetical protein